MKCICLSVFLVAGVASVSLSPTSATAPLAPPTTAPAVSPTDACSALMSASCGDVVASHNYLDIMQCAAKMAATLVDSKDTAAALCSQQMAGTIALTCVSDVQAQCDATASFEDLKDCSEDNQDDFSSACSNAIDLFKQDYKHALKSLLKKDWKEHHHSHHQQHHSSTAAQETVQWLWGGEIVSDPEADKHHKWMKYAEWAAGALVLIFVVFLVLCYRRRKARKLALARMQADGTAMPPQPAAPTTRWYHRFDVFGCRHPHRQLLAGNDHLNLQSTSRPSATAVESAPVRYAVA